MGADYIINPQKENFVEKVKEYTDDEGAALYLEATGLPQVVTEDIQNCIWESPVPAMSLCSYDPSPSYLKIFSTNRHPLLSPSYNNNSTINGFTFPNTVLNILFNYLRKACLWRIFSSKKG